MAFSPLAALKNLESYLGGRGAAVRGRGGRGGLFEFLEKRELLAANPPVVGPVAESVTENVPFHFALAAFTQEFGDTDQTLSLQAIEVTSLPAHGTLTLSGAAVTVNETIDSANVTNLTYTPTTGFVGSDVFGWNGSDGLDFATVGANVTLTVANRAPFDSPISVPTTAGVTLTLSTADFQGGFEDQDAGDTLQAIQVTSLPTHGTLALSGAAVKKGQVISAGSLANLTYTPDAGFVGSDIFGWDASDGKAFAKLGTTATIQIPSAFDVLGNGAPIVNGETSPVMLNLTDWGSMTTTPDVSLQTVTRTYTIQNSTGSAVTIGANAVTISGVNAADFTVVTQPTATSLATGTSETFEVKWAPVAAGKRIATINVASSAGPFAFEVQGTGIATNTIAAPAQSTPAGVVQEGTTQNGSGEGATNGMVMGITYTGYLANGTVFDSTSLHGNLPLVFRLDDEFLASTPQPFLTNDKSGDSPVDQNLIPGFEYGLQGAKVGEKRTLVINSDAGYGAQGNGANVPGNSTLIFDIEVVTLSTKPRLVVTSADSSGNPTALITAGQQTTNAGDNTLFTLSGAASVSQNFKLLTQGTVDVTGAEIGSFGFRTGQPIRIVGPGAKDFTFSLSNSILTITYHPQRPGDRFAAVHILTTDPQHPDYAFAIEGKSEAFADLTMGFDTVKFPTGTITSGSGKTLKIPLIVTNIGNSRTVGGSKTNIQIYAVNNSTNTFTLLADENGLNLGGLAPRGQRRISFTTPVPVTLQTGSYSVFAQINQSTLNDGTGNGTLRTLAEVNTANDAATAPQTIIVQQGTYQLTGVVTGSTVTATAAAVTGTVSISVQNSGTVFLPAGQAGTVEIVAHPVGVSDTDTSQDVVLESGAALVLGQLGFGGRRAGSVTVNYPAAGGTALAAGSYDLEARVTATGLLQNGVGVSTLILADGAGNRVVLTVP